MTLEDRIETGAQLKRKMNCCQAVARTAAKSSSPERRMTSYLA